MKQFSLPIYYLKFFLYLIGSFFLHMFLFILIASLTQGEYGGLIGLILGFASFPWGLWNFIFFIFALPVEQASKPQVWLGSVLGLPLLQLSFQIFLWGASSFVTSLPKSFLYLLGTVISNVIIFALAHAANVFRTQKQKERAEESSRAQDETGPVIMKRKEKE